MTDNTNNFFYR